MSSIPKNSKNSLKRTPRRSHARTCGAKTRNGEDGRTCSSASFSDKLEALKSLIPYQNGEIVKADQLFQETADYIVLLRTQVFVLQRLIDFYGSGSNERVYK